MLWQPIEPMSTEATFGGSERQRFNLLLEWKDVIIWYVFFIAVSSPIWMRAKSPISRFGHLCVSAQKAKVKISEWQSQRNLLPFIRSIHHTCSTHTMRALHSQPAQIESGGGERWWSDLMVIILNVLHRRDKIDHYCDCVRLRNAFCLQIELAEPKGSDRTSQLNLFCCPQFNVQMCRFAAK